MDKLEIRNKIISDIKHMSMEDILELFANIMAAILAEKNNFKFTTWDEFLSCIKEIYNKEGYTINVAAGLQTITIVEWINKVNK